MVRTIMRPTRVLPKRSTTILPPESALAEKLCSRESGSAMLTREPGGLAPLAD